MPFVCKLMTTPNNHATARPRSAKLSMKSKRRPHLRGELGRLVPLDDTVLDGRAAHQIVELDSLCTAPREHTADTQQTHQREASVRESTLARFRAPPSAPGR